MSKPKTHINSLPPLILAKVVQYLDHKTLKNATLTCKMWNHLTVSEGHWPLELGYDMKGKLLCKNSKDSSNKLKFIMDTKRKFGSIRMYGNFGVKNRMRVIFQKHGCNVAELSCCIGQVQSIFEFSNLLKLAPNLRYVYMSVLNALKDNVPLNYVFPDLKELKTLKIHTCDQQIIKCFQTAKLTTLIFNEKRSPKYSLPMVEFLSSQDMLTSLIITYSCRMLADMRRLNAAIPFRLKKLAISGTYGITSKAGHRDLLEFLTTQSQTLEQFEIGHDVPRYVFELCFSSMENLNSLSLIADEIPQDDNFCEQLIVNESVIKLDFKDFTLLDGERFGKFLEKLPNVRTLSTLEATNTLAVAQNMKKLESLYIWIVDTAGSFDSVQFTNLKTLHIKTLSCRINWNRLTQINSSLTELTIATIKNPLNFTSDDINDITTNVQLEILRLGTGFWADDRFFDIIRVKGGNLKVLQLIKSCIFHDLTSNEEVKVLQLCDEIKCSNYIHMMKM
ncbi:uncharacterized protein LOC119078282 [Bradysia coprophila]|uniref:uncharacterized protein LOC119078282 n=1 Tax=Bradysia coprophila TaxID=38358 RepID=UPI00187DAA21|nr:uncharacterized protein LOC119078282 [Bradysia coprophila]